MSDKARTLTRLSKTLPLNASALKLIAVITMLIDHIGAGLYRIPSVYSAYSMLRHIGRQAFPIFCFFIVEGFLRTRNRGKYLRNLLIFAVISQLPYHQALYPTEPFFARLNVDFSLALGLAAIWLIELSFEKISRIWLAILCAAGTTAGLSIAAYYLHVSYQWLAILLIATFYLLRKFPYIAMGAGYVLTCIYSKTELYALPAFILMLLYDGRRGRQSKYFFYAFYPAHLACIAMIRLALHL